ncbi:MAG: hypothetical protein ACFCVF_11445 [Kineosporiaceae bacterium]
MTRPVTPTSEVRLAPAVQAWLDAYAAGRPRWDDATPPAVRRRLLAEVERVTAQDPELPRSAVLRLVARETGLAEREIAAALG